MERVSADEVRAIVIEHNIRQFSLHVCKTCGKPIYYHFDGNMVSIDNCCDDKCDGTRESSYVGVATSFNRLEPVRERGEQWNKFLLAGDPADTTTPKRRRRSVGRTATDVVKDLLV